MREKTARGMRVFALLLILALFALLLTRSEALQQAAGDALAFSASKLIPALFPFAVLARFLAVGRLLPTQSSLAKGLAKLFGISAEGLPAFFLGLFCGYPMGAYTSACLLEEGRLTKEDAYAIAAISNNASAPFLCLTVSALFGDRRIGITLFASVTAASLLMALFHGCRVRKANQKGSQTPAPPLPPVSPRPFLPTLSDAIVKGGGAMLSLTAFVVFFATLSEAFRMLMPIESLAPLIPALLEATAAIRAAVALLPSVGTPAAVMLAAAALGWSGFSVLLQTEAQFQGKMPLSPLVATRAAIAALSALIARIVLLFLGIG